MTKTGKILTYANLVLALVFASGQSACTPMPYHGRPPRQTAVYQYKGLSNSSRIKSRPQPLPAPPPTIGGPTPPMM